MTRLKVLLLLFICSELKSQLSGTLQVPGTYSSIAAVISALNQQGVSAPLTVMVSSGYTETVPSGGFSMTATGTATAPIVFQKNGTGANPCVFAYAGNSTPGSASQDGIWRLIGSDYVTIDGFDLLDTNTIHPKTMEFGFGFFKVNGLDGCQHNTIKNCVVQLNAANNSSGSGGAGDGSKAINLVNASSAAQTTSMIVYAASGANSYNKFYSNVFKGCNIGVYLYGYQDSAPYNLSDFANDVGGASGITGNKILDFGGGTTGNPAIGVKTFNQYNCNISNNLIVNNTGTTSNHSSALKGISVGQAPGANVTVSQNTITLSGGASSASLMVIENAAGSTGTTNTVTISQNYILNCSYSTSVSGPFYGIYNNASPSHLNIGNNKLENNTTNASSGNTYLIYNNGNVSNLISIQNNTLGIAYESSTSYTGTLYSIYNNSGALTASLSIAGNYFSNYKHTNNPGSGTIYFVYNTADFNQLSIENNNWSDLYLNHSGAEYFIYNTSSTQSALRVCNNIVNGVKRLASAGNMYIYYSAANSAGTAIHTFSNNVVSNIQANISGTGNFYGIYNAEGNASPYPKKLIYENVFKDVYVNGTGNCYGIYCTGLGDAGSVSGSQIFNNQIKNIGFSDAVYGIYASGAGSASYPVAIYSNTIAGLYTSGANSTIYGSYLGSNNAGVLFYRNRISDLNSLGATGTVHGIYGTTTSTTTIHNNLIGNLYAPNSIGNGRVNGIYINVGSVYNVYFNTVFLNAVSTGTSFGSNALYASSTSSLLMRNNILINNSLPTGTGVVTAYRRSSTNLVTYLTGSDNNLFYAGTPTSSNVIFYNGSTSYQTLSSYKTAMSTRDMASVSQNPTFLSLLGSSVYFLHLSGSVSNSIESSANNISGISTDYDVQTRQGSLGYSGTGTAPDIGADEFETNVNPCSSVSSSSIVASATSLCAGASLTLNASTFSSGTGVNFQWKVGTQSSGPYTAVTGGSGASSIEYITGAMTVGTFYYILESTCANTSLSAVSNEHTVTVNAIPLANAQVANTLVCAGQPIVLSTTASTAFIFNWEGPNGFYAFVQNPSINNTHATSSGVYSLVVLSNGCISPQSTVAVTVSEVTATISASSNFLCSGNTSSITVTGNGSGYIWSTGSNSPSIAVSPATTQVYSVTTGNSFSCTTTKTILISVLSPTIQSIAAIACQTPATLSLSVNAFSPSIVNWYSSPSATNIIATGLPYTITVLSDTTFYAEAFDNASGCLSSRIPVSVTVSSSPTLTVTASQNTICPGKTTSLTAFGANTYSWVSLGSGFTKVVSPTVATTYTVFGSNLLGCFSQTTIGIYTFSLPLISLTQSSTSVCPSNPLVLTASGALTYTWSNGTIAPTATVFPAVNSTFTVYGSSPQNCVSNKTIAVATLSVPVIHVQSSKDSICPGESVDLSANGAISYTWLPGNTTGATTTVNPFVSSVYNVIGLSINGCTNIAFASLYVNPCTSISEEQNTGLIRVFPNPLRDVLFFEFSEVSLKSIVVEIFDQNSSLLHIGDLKFDNQTRSVQVGTLPPGSYYLRLKREGRVIFTRVLIKE